MALRVAETGGASELFDIFAIYVILHNVSNDFSTPSGLHPFGSLSIKGRILLVPSAHLGHGHQFLNVGNGGEPSLPTGWLKGPIRSVPNESEAIFRLTIPIHINDLLESQDPTARVRVENFIFYDDACLHETDDTHETDQTRAKISFGVKNAFPDGMQQDVEFGVLRWH